MNHFIFWIWRLLSFHGIQNIHFLHTSASYGMQKVISILSAYLFMNTAGSDSFDVYFAYYIAGHYMYWVKSGVAELQAV